MIVFDEAGASLEGNGHGRALGAMHPRADPSHHRRARRAAHASDLGHGAQHAAGQPAASGEPDRGVLPRPDRLRRHYTGLAATLEEGERLAAAMGDKPIVFMKNHGVLVTGDTVAQAYRRLYRLERVCRNQVLALGTGRPLQVLSDEIVARVKTPSRRPPPARRARASLLRGDDAHPRPRAAGIRRVEATAPRLSDRTLRPFPSG